MAFGFGEYVVRIMEPGKQPNEVRFASLPLAQSYANSLFIKTPVVRVFIMKGKIVIDSKSNLGYEKWLKNMSGEELARVRRKS